MLAEAEKAKEAAEARAAALERAKDTPARSEEITAILRPKGEPGDRKKGFNTQFAMGLEDDLELFQAIRVSGQRRGSSRRVTRIRVNIVLAHAAYVTCTYACVRT